MSTTYPTNINMESAKRLTRREAKKIVDSELGNNRTFDWQDALSRRIFSDDGLKDHINIINGKLKDNDVVMNLME